MRPILLLLLCTPYMWLGCAASGGSSAQPWENKIDPRLRAEMQDLKAESSKHGSFPVLIKFRASLSAAQKTELDEAGVRLLSQIGDIATAVLSPQTISELAKKDYIIYLEASKDRSFHTKPHSGEK